MRLHRLLLRLYPRSFRDEYGTELSRIFARRRRDATGAAAVATLWASEIADTAATAGRVHFDILRQDLHCSLRAFARAPGFFLAAVLVAALGIGATTASFTLADHVLIRPLPFPEPDRLVKIWEGSGDRPPGARGLGGTNDVSAANYRDWKALSTSFARMGVYGFVSSTLVDEGEPERLTGASVSVDAMRVLGIAPALGRAFDDADDRAGAPCTILISDAFWRRKFLGDRAVIGRRMVLDNEACNVVGVMPPGFAFPLHDTAFWRPIRLSPAAYEDRRDTYLRVVARLNPGTTLEQASADLERVSRRLMELYPRENEDIHAVALHLRDEIGDQARVMIFAVAGASACLLLIACTNLASLFLARATSRAHELAVRSALGAGSGRLFRQLVTDTLLVAFAGAALGMLLGLSAVPLGAELVPTLLPVAEVPAADVRMLMVAAVGTLVTILACGVLPALTASRHAVAGTLRDDVRTGTSRQTERLRGALVIGQVAASVALLVCAGLLLRALWRVQAIDPGFHSDGVLAMRLNLSWPQYATNAARARLYRRVLEDVEALPSVTSAAFASYLPLTMRGGVWGVFRPGQPLDPGNARGALARYVTPAYFDVMGIPLKEGRPFDDRDALGGEQTAIVSETFSDAMWPGDSSIGRRIIVMRTERTIVGVVGEVKVRGLERRSEPQLYLPSAQQPDDSFVSYTARDLAVRTSVALGGAAMGALAAEIRGIVARADPQLAVSDIRPLAEIVEADTFSRAVQANVLRAFAAVSYVLAGVGLYGLLVFVVSARTREIGVRMAFGATPRHILGMVLARGARLAVIGAAAGLGAGYLAGRSFSVVLAGVHPADALTLVGAALFSAVMTLAASIWPAIRAARTDPVTATRTE